LTPETEQRFWYRRPCLAGCRMRRLVAVAALLVGDPAEFAAIGHADAHLLAGPGHGRNVERGDFDDTADVVHQRGLRGAVEMAGQVTDAFGQGRIVKRRHQSSPTRPRSFFTLARPDFSFSLRSIDPLVGLVFLRGFGGGSAALAPSSVRRARASARFCSWVRKRPASMTTTPSLVARWPASLMTRARTRSESPSAAAASKRSC